jgi:hypothetical protein
LKVVVGETRLSPDFAGSTLLFVTTGLGAIGAFGFAALESANQPIPDMDQHPLALFPYIPGFGLLVLLIYMWPRVQEFLSGILSTRSDARKAEGNTTTHSTGRSTYGDRDTSKITSPTDSRDRT